MLLCILQSLKPWAWFFFFPKKNYFSLQKTAWIYLNHFFTFSTLFINVIKKENALRCTYQKNPLNSPIKTKCWGVQGAIIFENWRRIWKEIARNGRRCKKCSFHYIHVLIEGFQAYIPLTDVINFVSNNEWRYVEGSLMWLQLLPNSWRIGTDLKDKTGSCCLWACFLSVTKALENKEGSQSLIRACQG